MRHLHNKSHFRHALFALQGPDGYVEALLEMTRSRAAGQRFPEGQSMATFAPQLSISPQRKAAELHFANGFPS